MKKCIGCKETDLKNFSIKGSTGEFKAKCNKCLTKAKLHYNRNKEKYIERSKKRFIKKREEVAKYQKEYLEKNRDKLLKYKSEYYQKNKDRLLAVGREWRAENKWRKKVYKGNRKAQIKATNSLTITEVEWLKCLYGENCIYCMKFGNELDHIKPLWAGGTNSLDNIVIACKSCNCSKQRKFISEWWTEEKLELFGDFRYRLSHYIDQENYLSAILDNFT